MLFSIVASPICVPTNIVQRFIDKGPRLNGKRQMGTGTIERVPSNGNLNNGRDLDIVLGAVQGRESREEILQLLPSFHF